MSLGSCEMARHALAQELAAELAGELAERGLTLTRHEWDTLEDVLIWWFVKLLGAI